MKIIDKIIENIDIIKSVGMWLMIIGTFGYIYLTYSWLFEYGVYNCGALCYPVPERLIKFFTASVLTGFILSVFSIIVIVDFNRKIHA